MIVLDDGVGFLLLLEEGQESCREGEVADVVHFELLLEEIEVDTGRLGKVEGALDPGIQEDAVKVWVAVRHTLMLSAIFYIM